MAAGSHQALMGADSIVVGEKLMLDESSQEDIRKSSDDMGYMIGMPFRDIYLNVEDGLSSDSTESNSKRGRGRNAFWMPASLQAKLAMKKKPVVKWRPYMKPGTGPSIDIDGIPPNDLPPGVFEDECAFMWRTIHEDSDSPGHSDSPRKEGTTNHVRTRKNRQRLASDASRTSSKESLVLLTNDTINKSRIKRTKYKVKGRTRHGSSKLTYKSLPILTENETGQILINSRFLRSLSLASNFLEAISYRIQKEHWTNDFKSLKKDSKTNSSKVLQRSSRLPSPTMGKSNST